MTQETIIIESSPEGPVVRGAFPIAIRVDGRFLDMVTRGETVDGSVRVSGHVEPVAGSITRTVWDSITFVCVNGTATYDFVEQNGEDRQRDQWCGARRDLVEDLAAR